MVEFSELKLDSIEKIKLIFNSNQNQTENFKNYLREISLNQFRLKIIENHEFLKFKEILNKLFNTKNIWSLFQEAKNTTPNEFKDYLIYLIKNQNIEYSDSRYESDEYRREIRNEKNQKLNKVEETCLNQIIYNYNIRYFKNNN